LNSGLWVRRLLIGGSPDQGRYPASEVNDEACPDKPVHLNARSWRRGHECAIQLLLGGPAGSIFFDPDKIFLRFLLSLSVSTLVFG
jgi:hypothetical protein